MSIKKLEGSEGFKLLLTIILVADIFFISVNWKEATDAISNGITYTIVLNSAEASEVAGEGGSLVEAQAETGGLSQLDVNSQAEPSIEQLVRRYFGSEWKTAYAVMMAESSGDPMRIGDKHLPKPSVGLFQINQIWHHYTTEQLQNPEFNVMTAKEIRDRGGWERWTTYRTNQYKQFL